MEHEPDSNNQKNRQKAKNQLEETVNQLADLGKNRVEQIFGPLRETNIPKDELDKLFAEAGSLTHQELAQRCYGLAQKYPAEQMPKPFQQHLDKKNR